MTEGTRAGEVMTGGKSDVVVIEVRLAFDKAKRPQARCAGVEWVAMARPCRKSEYSKLQAMVSIIGGSTAFLESKLQSLIMPTLTNVA